MRSSRRERSVRRAFGGIAVAVVVLAGCSSSSDSPGGDAVGLAPPSSVTTAPPTATSEASDDGPALASVCDLVTTDEVDAITGLSLELQVEPGSAGAPFGRCAWENTAANTVGASVVARSLVNEGVASPDEWWSRNLDLLEDAVLEVRPLPAFGEDAYLAVDERKVEVLWFPDPATYVETRVDGAGWGDAPRPSPAEFERMVVELNTLLALGLEPHLPLPQPSEG